ncbi:MAG: HAMP domain-containing sensor histidine kinase [Acidimicrobiia bacterium]
MIVLLAMAGAVWVVAPRSVGEPVSSVAIFVGALVGGITFIRRSRFLTGREHRAWTLVGWGFTVGSFGMVAIGVTAVVQGDAPAFGIADAIFVLGYLGVLVGFASLPHTSGTQLLRLRTGLDGLIGAVAVGALLWALVLEPVVTNLSDVPTWQTFIGSIYPLVDLAALVVFMIVTVRQSSLRFDLRIILLATGIFAQATADVLFFVSGVGRSLTEAQPLQLLYIFAIICYVATSAIVDRVPQPRQYSDRRTPLWALVAPYGAAIAMVTVLAVRLWDADLDRADEILLVATFIVGGLVIARQGIAIRENRIVVEQQRSDLVSSISHELRTPLTAMVGFLAVLQDDPNLAVIERREMIDVVAEQTGYLERVVEDMLALAHGDPDRMELNVSEHNVAALIETSVRSAAIDSKRVTVEVQSGLEAIVDGSRLQQVLVNLLTNASWYGGEECVVVAFSRAGGLIIEVHDSGPGVPKQYELTIWERFERGENRYNANVPGSGIGLAMVKNIAESHGGTAKYRRSERLGGACFVIDLPGRVGKQRPIAIVPSTTRAIG